MVALWAFACYPLAAQPAATGQTTLGAVYDPSRPPAAQPQPHLRALRRTTLPLFEYQSRQAAASRRSALSFGPPRLELRDNLSLLRSPGPLPDQPLSLAPTSSFEGIQQTLLSPPDPDIAAGPEDILLVVNSSIARYSKAGQQTNLQTLQQWFANLIPAICPSGAGGCRMVDPTIRYDSLHGRFLLSCFSENATSLKTHFLLSVSNSSSFSGGWKNWALEGSRNGTVQTSFEIDFPQLGYDANAVYLTANMFNAADVFQYAKIRILKKAELYTPATTTLTFQDLWDLRNEDGTRAETIQPTLLRGRPGSGIPPGVLINASTTANADFLTLWRIESPLSPTPVATRTTLRNIWRYDLPALISQRGTTWRLDPGDTRILKAIVRNGILFTARNTGYSADPTTVTYDRIDLAPNRVTLQSRHISGTFFFPAFDVPASLGPANALPNKLITGTSTDSSGAAAFLGLTDVKAGEDSFEAGNRWGDYSGAAIDPILGGLWVYGEYAKLRAGTSGRWGTWAALFPVATTPQFTDVPSSSPFFDSANILRLWSITTGCTPDRYCPANNVTRGEMAVFLVRSLLGDNFSFPPAPYFTDVPATHPFFNFIQKLRELGVTSGCTATTYCPDASVTRGQMAVFLVRGKFLALLGDNFSFPQNPYFSDVPAADPLFGFIQKLRELGITSGCTATTYCPASPVTREQMAAFLVRSFLN